MFAKYVSPALFRLFKKSPIYRYLYLRRNALSDFPLQVNIELTNRCNLKCSMCPHPTMENLELGEIDFDFYTRVVDQVAKISGKRTSFYPVGLGEPLMYSRLREALVYFRRACPHNPIHMTTNGVLLDSEKSETICKVLGMKRWGDFAGGGDRLLVSLNAGTRKTYAEVMGVDNFELVVENIENFISMRKEIGGGPNLVIQLIETKKTAPEIEDFVRYWKPRIEERDHVYVRPLLDWGGKIDIKETAVKKTPDRYPCVSLWIVMVIDYTGNVYPCCEALSTREKSDLLLGNIRDKPLEDIYRESIMDFRDKHLTGRWGEIPECSACISWSFNPNIWFKRANRWI